ncbi:MBL fold metallo-hydrolase [Rhizorhabdus histidinilytica]|uniref:Ribonuclease BN, tRNA processing enzyme n=2 Tax=Rhizorhabdus histidinilytica TaxID=439228 RepID=A0A1T5F2W5_9SPHN|nr:MBL fold metallo-hydrolase [Rhizorhabdus histidinilytica]SKB90567.1 Ribonuclease BN, tRNA processing enzyme [Rhizorhabdus histidinilytica]
MLVGRRTVVSGMAAALGALALPGWALPQKGTHAVLLGTKGGPSPIPERAAPSTALVIDGRLHLVDCGNGVAHQLAKAGIALPLLNQVYITHNHSDHVIDVATLLVLAWAAGLATPVAVHGPPPIAEIVKNGLGVSAYDMAARMREEGRPPLEKLITVRERDTGGLVYRDDSVTVRSALVDHYTVRPAFAYRFDTADRSIVISGDTTYSEALAELARDADVLIHEALYEPFLDRISTANAPTLRDHLRKSHTTTEQIGQLAAKANVGKVVLTHLVPAVGVTDEEWIVGVQKYYRGEIVVGRDLMVI